MFDRRNTPGFGEFRRPLVQFLKEFDSQLEQSQQVKITNSLWAEWERRQFCGCNCDTGSLLNLAREQSLHWGDPISASKTPMKMWTLTTTGGRFPYVISLRINLLEASAF